MWWGGPFGTSAGGVFRELVVLVVIGLVVAGIVLLVRSYTHKPEQRQPGPSHPFPPTTGGPMSPPAPPRPFGPPPTAPARPAPDSALRLLEERYARGEIGREEFLQRRADLLS